MNKKLIFFIVIIVLVVFSYLFYTFYIGNKETLKNNPSVEIKTHYGSLVKVNNESVLYDENENEIGLISSGEIINLENITITNDTKYFPFIFDDITYYIPYENVSPTDEVVEIDARHKNYIPFNEVINAEEVSIYNDDKLVMEVTSLIDKEIIKKTSDKVYFEINDTLYNANISDVIISDKDLGYKYAEEIPVTAYHFIHTDDDKTCNQIICHSESQIKEQFDYLKENNYFTITTDEMESFLNEEINLPEKTILITIDDGWTHEVFVPIINEYGFNVTVFVVTSWFEETVFDSPYIELAGHTHDLHDPWKCTPNTYYSQGSPLICYDEEKLVEDFKQNRFETNNSTAFCYPYYEYSNKSIEALKKAGFTTAYKGGQYKASRDSDPYKIPRITIHNSTSLSKYIDYVS